MEIVINKCHGGFDLSQKAKNLYCQLKNLTDDFHCYDIERNDPILIEVVKQLGKKANSAYSKLKIVDIPDGIGWYIDEYNGMECVNESHRSWD